MIGMFDSGSGGLSVLKELRARAPWQDIVYFGDIENAPYGVRSREELGALTVIAVEKLLGERARHIVSACNSVSASIVLPIIDILGVRPFEIIEMVGPTVRALKGKRGKKICVLATPATVQSKIYAQGFGQVGIAVDEVAVPELAGAIEFGAPREEVRAIVRDAVSVAEKRGHEIVLLACTHYPLALDLFHEEARRIGFRGDIIDPACAVAEEAVDRFGSEGDGTTRFLLTRDSQQFRKLAEQFFHETPWTVEVL